MFPCVWAGTVSLWLLVVDRTFGSVSPREEGAHVVILHKEDSGQQVQVRSGDVIEVELDGTGGSGYWWHVANLDTTYTELISEETKTAAEIKLGGPVRGIWRFKGRKPGRVELIMKYYRAWEGPERAVDQFSAILNII
jgi:predicted secreted protein